MIPYTPMGSTDIVWVAAVDLQNFNDILEYPSLIIYCLICLDIYYYFYFDIGKI